MTDPAKKMGPEARARADAVAASRVRARQAMELAQLGKYRCMGRCRKVKDLHEGIVVTWGGNVLFGMCPECFPAVPIVMREREMLSGGRGIYVGPLNEQDRAQANVVPVADLSEVGGFVPAEALAQYERKAGI